VKQKLSEKDHKVLNLLHQIEEVNKMIDLHSHEGGISLMKQQYEEIRNKYIEELNSLVEAKNILSLRDIKL
jgi:geranylgeranyl pyrophosphate synthase